MLTIINGSLKALQAEMKGAKSDSEKELKSLIKLYEKKEVDAGKISAEKKQKLRECEQRIALYTSSKCLPVWVDYVMIDFKVYSEFMKKLKGFSVTHEISVDGIEVRYWKTDARQCGKLHLSDLAKHFEGFMNIPVAVIQDVEEA